MLGENIRIKICAWESKTTSPSIVLNVAGNVVNNGIIYRTSQYRVHYWILGQLSSRSGGKAGKGVKEYCRYQAVLQ